MYFVGNLVLKPGHALSDANFLTNASNYWIYT